MKASGPFSYRLYCLKESSSATHLIQGLVGSRAVMNALDRVSCHCQESNREYSVVQSSHSTDYIAAASHITEVPVMSSVYKKEPWLEHCSFRSYGTVARKAYPIG